jgi:hypothetical protein
MSKCQSCDNVYAGQTISQLNTRFPEHLRYVKTNNSLSTYALHVLNNQQHYGPMGNTMDLIESALKG